MSPKATVSGIVLFSLGFCVLVGYSVLICQWYWRLREYKNSLILNKRHSSVDEPVIQVTMVSTLVYLFDILVIQLCREMFGFGRQSVIHAIELTIVSVVFFVFSFSLIFRIHRIFRDIIKKHRREKLAWVELINFTVSPKDIIDIQENIDPQTGLPNGHHRGQTSLGLQALSKLPRLFTKATIDPDSNNNSNNNNNNNGGTMGANNVSEKALIRANRRRVKLELDADFAQIKSPFKYWSSVHFIQTGAVFAILNLIVNFVYWFGLYNPAKPSANLGLSVVFLLLYLMLHLSPFVLIYHIQSVIPSYEDTLFVSAELTRILICVIFWICGLICVLLLYALVSSGDGSPKLDLGEQMLAFLGALITATSLIMIFYFMTDWVRTSLGDSLLSIPDNRFGKVQMAKHMEQALKMGSSKSDVSNKRDDGKKTSVLNAADSEKDIAKILAEAADGLIGIKDERDHGVSFEKVVRTDFGFDFMMRHFIRGSCVENLLCFYEIEQLQWVIIADMRKEQFVDIRGLNLILFDDGLPQSTIVHRTLQIRGFMENTRRRYSVRPLDEVEAENERLELQRAQEEAAIELETNSPRQTDDFGAMNPALASDDERLSDGVRPERAASLISEKKEDGSSVLVIEQEDEKEEHKVDHVELTQGEGHTSVSDQTIVEDVQKGGKMSTADWAEFREGESGGSGLRLTVLDSVGEEQVMKGNEPEQGEADHALVVVQDQHRIGEPSPIPSIADDDGDGGLDQFDGLMSTAQAVIRLSEPAFETSKERRRRKKRIRKKAAKAKGLVLHQKKDSDDSSSDESYSESSSDDSSAEDLRRAVEYERKIAEFKGRIHDLFLKYVITGTKHEVNLGFANREFFEDLMKDRQKWMNNDKFQTKHSLLHLLNPVKLEMWNLMKPMFGQFRRTVEYNKWLSMAEEHDKKLHKSQQSSGMSSPLKKVSSPKAGKSQMKRNN